MNKKVWISLSLGLSLSGCSQYASDFDCPYGQGLGCSSLSTVSKTLDSQALDLESDLQGVSSMRHSKAAIIYFGKERMGKLIKIDSKLTD